MSNYFSESFSLTGTTTQGLPGISTPLILQQCIPVVCFPLNFHFLHSKLNELDRFFQILCYSQVKSSDDNFNTNFYNHLSANVPLTVTSLDNESLQLYVLHLMPYYNNSLTSFDAILTTFDTVTKYLNPDQIIRVFSPLLQDLYDQTSLSPQCKAQILHRPFLNTLIHRFGLAHFCERFISHVVEAVINPSGVHSKKEHKKGQNLLKDDQFLMAKKEENIITRETKQQLSLLLDNEPESSSDEEGDDVAYTSLLAQTPLQTPSSTKPSVRDAAAKEERTYSVCSDDLISMEPIMVVRSPNFEPIRDEDINADDTLTHNSNLLPYRSSPDITANNFVFNLVMIFIINILFI